MQNFTQNFKDRVKYDQFNNFRIDLNIILVQNGETVLVNHKDSSMLVNLYDLSTLAAVIGDPLERCAKFLMDSMADTPDEYLTADYAMVIGLRKEAGNMQGDDVRMRMWCESYNTHADLEGIKRNNPILDIFNRPLEDNPLGRQNCIPKPVTESEDTVL